MLDIAWGKFRNHERALDPRMTRAELAGARRALDVLIEDGPRALPALGNTISGEERAGAIAFAVWIKANAKRLKTKTAKAADVATTNDKLTVELSQ